MTAPASFTVGVEEEYLVVDPDSRAPVVDARRVLQRAGEELGGRVHSELQLAQLEVSTGVCTELSEVRAELTRLRHGLAAIASREGAAIAASGTHPFAHWSEGRITPTDAYLKLERDYQQLAREQLICGCHVHVGIEDPEQAIQVLNRLRPWLSPLVALAANSPYWMGADTGYASYRTEVWRRWPMAGTPEVFENRAEYDRLLDQLLTTGSIDAPARVYFDVRPSARYPTLELRVTDVCLTVDEAVMIAGLVRGMTRAAHAQAVRDEPLPVARSELLRAATWRAARHGLDGDLVDPVSVRAAPAADVVAALMAFARPALEDGGDWDEVSELVERTVASGTGAARQRRAYQRSGKLEDVVDLVVAETQAGVT